MKSIFLPAALLLAGAAVAAAPDWMRTARVALFDAYQYPFAPKLEFDAEAVAKAMAEMHVNTIRFPSIGKYATLQGVRFSRHPDQGGRDLLREMIAAAKPRGIRVIVYIGTGHKLAWSMVTRDYPEYAQKTSPGGGPDRNHFFVGEDHGTICWNTPYRQAYLQMVEHIVRDYDIDGVYFDRWTAHYFWPGMKVCYCDGCRRGFRAASGEELPWHENRRDYTAAELATIERYHKWYQEVLMGILAETRQIVKKHKDIPLINNINNPHLLAREDPRVLAAMDAFLYERGNSMLERAEGVSLARAAGFGVWPYVGGYNNWPRVDYAGFDYSQEIYTTAMFGGGNIIAQPTGYVEQTESRQYISEPFAILSEHEADHRGFENVPYAAVIYSEKDPPGHAQAGWWWKADSRSASLGAFAACLYGHVQVTSALEGLLDHPDALARYRVVYLADLPQLSAARVRNLEGFVRQGGGLVVSYATSMYDESGSRRESFGLEDLIRVRPVKREGAIAELMRTYSTILGGPNDLYLLARSGSGVGPAWKDRLVPAWHFEPVEALAGGKVLMDIVTGDGRPVLPAVVESSHGNGRVIYCASSIESLYSGNQVWVLGDLMREMVDRAGGRARPYELEGPATLVANLTANGNRRVLHLTNWTGDGFERSHLSRYYVAPVENVKIRIPGGVKDLRCYPGKALTTERRGTSLEITLPRVGVYEAVTWRE
jgi:hypothetical protein